MINASAALVAWTIPAPEEHNGPLLGYQVRPFLMQSYKFRLKKVSIELKYLD